MRSVTCPACGPDMKRNGTTSAGTQRWRCGSCGASATLRHDDEAKRPELFLARLMSRDSQLSMAGAGRTFGRKTSEFRGMWPMPTPDGGRRRVLHVDGIWLDRRLAVLVCRGDGRVVSRCLAEAETARAWSALMAPAPAPDVVVAGGGGFAKAVGETWPGTRVQRCVFHAFCQVKRCTTSRPRLQAGVGLYGLAKDLLGLESLRRADLWVERHLQWRGFWADSLEDAALVDGQGRFTHERLRKAGASLNAPARAGTLFACLDPEPTAAGPLPSTNNRIGGLSSRIRAMPGNRRGLSSLKRVKAVFWRCHMRSGDTRSSAELLASMPADEDIDFLFSVYSSSPKRDDGGPEWGDRVVWGGAPSQGPLPLLAGLGHVFYPDTHFVL